MAVDKLVDSTQLDACLTAEANAIRAKTGGSANLTFDFANSKGFADAIAAIPSGGGIELLVDDTTTEDVAIINVAIPSDKQRMKAYLVGLYGTTSASDWVYPHLNASASSTAGSCYFAKASSYNLVAVFGKAGGGTGGYVWGFYATGRPDALYTSGSSLTNILFNLYDASSRFKTGFNVKVWGVPTP